MLDGFTVKVELDDSGEGHGSRTANECSGWQILNNVADADLVTAVFPGCDGRRPSLIRRNHFYNRLGVATSSDEPYVVARNLVIDDNRGARGLVILPDATGNSIAENQMTGNRPWDAEDQSVGSGTAGTGSLWTDNQINACSPPGICEP